MANDGTVKIGTELDDSGFKSGLSKLGSVASTALKGTTAAIGAASAAIGVLSTKSLEAYSSYEQLTGGVETLFKESADTVMQYADNAYKTAGMSANAYMETVTSFSASLLQGLEGDTAAAAEIANQAITDMSDNANKMGTSMEMIQNAYQGFAKQNYTMLDNLKLGYGGTQAEMARLINDSGVLGDTMTVTAETVNQVSFDKIIEAIHVVQTEMGITGTTAKEAATTIEGSVNSAKASWNNLITGIADDNADLDTLINNFVSSVETAASNILPRIVQILSGMGSTIQELAPILSEQIPILIEQVVPSLINAGAQLIVGLITGLISAAPQLVSAIPSIIQSIYSALQDSGPQMISAGSELLSMVGNGILEYTPELIASLPDVITGILNFLTDNFPTIIEKGGEFLGEFAFGIVDAIPDLVSKLPEVILAIGNFFVENFPTIIKTGAEIIGKLIVGLISAIPEIRSKLPEIIIAIAQVIRDGWETIKEAGIYLIEGLWAGISDKIEWLKGKVTGVIDTIKGWFTGKDGFDEHSPSKWSQSVMEYVMDGLAIGAENGSGKVLETVDDIIGEIKDRVSSISDALSLRQDVGDLQYELWERTVGSAATEEEKFAKQLELLQKQQTDQEGIIEAASAAYQAVAEQYGKNSTESYEYQKTLLEEMLAYQDIIDKINELIEAKKELGSVDISSAIPAASFDVSSANAAMTPSSISNPRFSVENAVASAAGLSALSNSSNSREIVLTLNGREVARGLIDNIRTVEKQTPAIQFN